MNNLYFCEKCRIQVLDASELHFVEEGSDRGFCSENCILDFYKPYMLRFEQEEQEWRKELMLGAEKNCEQLLTSDDHLQKTLDEPSEVFVFETNTGQLFHTHINELQVNGELYFSILIVSYIEGSPSFVFYRTLTQSQGLTALYRRGDFVEPSKDVQKEQSELLSTMTDEEIELAEEILDEVESKKSMLLADLLMKRSDNDIDFERFHYFDKYLELTTAAPDEVYEFIDDHGDKLFTNIKSFKLDEEFFFYIVFTLPYKNKQGVQSSVQVPVLGFPSNDKDLYSVYAQGTALNEKLKN